MTVSDIIKQHGDEVEAITIEYCAKIAEIHLRPERGELDRGFNKAVRDIAASIRKLNGE